MNKGKAFGILIIILGICLPVLPLPWATGYSPSLGVLWNITNVNVQFYENLFESYMDVAGFRDRYPMYNDLTDEEVTERLHRKYFGDMPYEEYRSVFLGAAPGERSLKEYGGKPLDILEIRGEIEDFADLDPITKAILMTDTVDYGLYDLRLEELSVPYKYPFMAGVVLVAAGAAVLFFSRKRKKG
jgi:hypothetical protein